jgi:uncharacterized 2Fe-2S/4Fe-4S cluster protein (DUF4445 family)
MIEIKIHKSGGIETIQGEIGLSLLEILQENGQSVYAPCGGKGTCGKCRMQIKGEGRVLSCLYYPDNNIDIILPDKNEVQILTDQTEFLEDFPVDGNIGYKLDNPVGVAIDIGTTTVVMYFVDLLTGYIEKIASFLNPQNVYGADVISRINYCQENNNGLSQQQDVIIEAINYELENFCVQKQINNNSIIKIAIAGNTTMMHLLLGIDPESIALAPFVPKFKDKQIVSGKDLGLSINKKAEIVTLPCISAYVGADIVAGLSVLKPVFNNCLFLDIGTNGELALVSGSKIYVCATAAGPAFEGANLACGMGAVQGAVSVYQNPGQYSVIGDDLPKGICGSGIVDVIAYLVSHNLVDETGLLQTPFFIDKENNIYVSQDDIREIQLAKSAIYSGIKILMKNAGLEYNTLDALFLAGGFGNYIDIDSAIQIGLLPYEMKGKIYPIGNSAGIGTLQYLKSQNFAGSTEKIPDRTIHIELSEDEDFTIEFALNMNFQNMK